MVIGRVLPESLSSSNINSNVLSESTNNNIMKSLNINSNTSNSNINKYSSRLQSISPIKLSNSIDSDGSDEDTTNATTIHYTNNSNSGSSKNNLLNIFTPNTATTAVESNPSQSSKSNNNSKNSKITKQETKLKKLRQFSEQNKLVEEDINNSSKISAEILQKSNSKGLKEKTNNNDYFHLNQEIEPDFQEYNNSADDEGDDYFEQDIRRFSSNRQIPFEPVEKRRQKKTTTASRKKSISKNLNSQHQLRFVDDSVYEEEEEGDVFDEDLQNYAFLVEQQERLIYEQQQLKIQQERVNKLSRSASLRNLQHNIRSSINSDSPIKQQRVLSRSSSKNTLSSYLPQQQQQLMGHAPRVNNAKSMMNLRPSFSHRKSISSNPNNIVYEEGVLMEEIEPVYSNPKSNNHMYSQQQRPKAMPRFKSMNNLRINSIREDNFGVPRKQSAYLRPRVSSSSLYEHQFEEDSLMYENDYDYEYDNEYIDDTFQEDFQSQHLPFSQQQQQQQLNYPQDKRMLVDYWSLPQEVNTAPFSRNQRQQYQLQPLRVQPISKRDQLRNFREQQHQQQQMAMHKSNRTKHLKIIPKQAAKFKDGDKSGMMTYDAAEKRWVGNMGVLEEMEFLPDVRQYKQQVPPHMHVGKAQRQGISRSMSYQNFKHEVPEESYIDIDVQFASFDLAHWYSFEVSLAEKIGHWISTKNEETDDWEIYDLVLGSNN